MGARLKSLLQKLRMERGLTQVALSKLCGIPQPVLSAIENNKATLGLNRAKKLARALKVHPGLLLFPDLEPK